MLAKDERTRYRLSAHDGRAFYLTSGNLAAQQTAEAFIADHAAIWERAVESGPSFFAATRSSIRRIDLSS